MSSETSDHRWSTWLYDQRRKDKDFRNGKMVGKIARAWCNCLYSHSTSQYNTIPLNTIQAIYSGPTQEEKTPLRCYKEFNPEAENNTVDTCEQGEVCCVGMVNRRLAVNQTVPITFGGKLSIANLVKISWFELVSMKLCLHNDDQLSAPLCHTALKRVGYSREDVAHEEWIVWSYQHH